MSEMTPLDAGFDLSIRGFGQASGGARARRGATAACRTQRAGGSDGGHLSTLFADIVTVASVISATSLSFGVRILDPKIKLTATCVRVPVFIGHSEAINIEFEEPLSAEEAREILRNAVGCLAIDKRESGGYVTPYECAGEDAIYVSRIREDAAVENGLVLWCLSANLRKGAVPRRANRRMPDRPQVDPGEEAMLMPIAAPRRRSAAAARRAAQGRRKEKHGLRGDRAFLSKSGKRGGGNNIAAARCVLPIACGADATPKGRAPPPIN
jgi:hypothetical protein